MIPDHKFILNFFGGKYYDTFLILQFQYIVFCYLINVSNCFCSFDKNKQDRLKRFTANPFPQQTNNSQQQTTTDNKFSEVTAFFSYRLIISTFIFSVEMDDLSFIFFVDVVVKIFFIKFLNVVMTTFLFSKNQRIYFFLIDSLENRCFVLLYSFVSTFFIKINSPWWNLWDHEAAHRCLQPNIRFIIQFYISNVTTYIDILDKFFNQPETQILDRF